MSSGRFAEMGMSIPSFAARRSCDRLRIAHTTTPGWPTSGPRITPLHRRRKAMQHRPSGLSRDIHAIHPSHAFFGDTYVIQAMPPDTGGVPTGPGRAVG